MDEGSGWRISGYAGLSSRAGNVGAAGFGFGTGSGCVTGVEGWIEVGGLSSSSCCF